MVVDGAINGELFLVYVEQILLPALPASAGIQRTTPAVWIHAFAGMTLLEFPNKSIVFLDGINHVLQADADGLFIRLFRK